MDPFRKMVSLLLKQDRGARGEEVRPMVERWSHSRPNACYNNAFLYASERPGCRYVLGYLFVGGSVPIEHAWVWDPKRGHLEVTLPTIAGDRWVEMHRPGMRWCLDFAMEAGYPPAAHEYRRAKQQGAKVNEGFRAIPSLAEFLRS